MVDKLQGELASSGVELELFLIIELPATIAILLSIVVQIPP